MKVNVKNSGPESLIVYSGDPTGTIDGASSITLSAGSAAEFISQTAADWTTMLSSGGGGGGGSDIVLDTVAAPPQYPTSSTIGVWYGSGTKANHGGFSSVTIGDGAATLSGGTSVGRGTFAAGVSVGIFSISQFATSVGIGNSALGWANSSIAIGASTFANGTGSIAIGTSAATSNNDTIVIGSQAVSSGIESVSIGRFASAPNYAIKIGTGASGPLGAFSVAVGYGATTQVQYGLALGGSTTADTFAGGGAGYALAVPTDTYRAAENGLYCMIKPGGGVPVRRKFILDGATIAVYRNVSTIINGQLALWDTTVQSMPQVTLGADQYTFTFNTAGVYDVYVNMYVSNAADISGQPYLEIIRNPGAERAAAYNFNTYFPQTVVMSTSLLVSAGNTMRIAGSIIVVPSPSGSGIPNASANQIRIVYRG
jgi:hypothetical protein